jgi:hypothetical protein
MLGCIVGVALEHVSRGGDSKCLILWNLIPGLGWGHSFLT